MKESLSDEAVIASSSIALESLWRDHGFTALAIAAFRPGLQACLDQHGAAVRDALSPGIGMITVTALAGYVAGLVDELRRHGTHLSARPDWARPSWLDLRLAAVCELARQYGHVPTNLPE
ncbi:MAG: hypothetical protein H0T78_08515 [Longispora sp.]|nr:hypothetical protein [Longispora sp. (in: high G+C Gram-positive bacteria)]